LHALRTGPAIRASRFLPDPHPFLRWLFFGLPNLVELWPISGERVARRFRKVFALNNNQMIMTTRTEKLIDDIRNVATHAEELLESTSGQLNEKARAARLRLNGSLDSARRSCEELQAKAAAGLETTEDAIKTHPYQTVGLALGVGLILGAFLSRRS
jgi:ElaB/YqjD/DUF883 family membrane-anchored ribosome-binding protein